jgi:hypothetical protein
MPWQPPIHDDKLVINTIENFDDSLTKLADSTNKSDDNVDDFK